MQSDRSGQADERASGRATRWLAIALAGVGLITLLTWIPIDRGGVTSGEWQADGAHPGGEGAVPASASEGCAPGAPPANLDLTLKDAHGRDVRLTDYKGQVIVLNFWATWCGPCRFEIPTLIELQDRYRSRGVAVLGVSVDDPMESLAPFASEFRMNYRVLVGRDREDLRQAFGDIPGVPTTFFIGRDGRICSKHVGLASKADLEREIKGLL